MPSTAIKHLKHLSMEIGPRGSTSPQEKRAHEYARDYYESLGLETHWDTFTSPTSGWRPFALATLAGLIALPFGLLGSQTTVLAAGLFMLVVTTSVMLEMHFQPNPLRFFLKKGQSQNVWALIPPKNESKRVIVLTGHVDTQRTPWAFSSVKRLGIFQLFNTLGVVAFFISTFAFLAMGFLDFGNWRWLMLLFVPIYLAVLFFTGQADKTPFTHGANDNGSGASVVMSLAGQLAKEPLQNIEVWALSNGCEEVGGHGVKAFLSQHRQRMNGASIINLDNVGGEGAGVCYASREGMLLPLKPSPELLALADEIAAERENLNAYSRIFTTLHTDGSVFMLHGIPTLSFVGQTPEGKLPNWHQVSDTFERVNPKAVEDTETFVLEMLRRLDERSGETH